jgi:predicted transcriptional regulator
MNRYPTFTIRISQQLANRLRAEADALGISRGELMRQALTNYFKGHN